MKFDLADLWSYNNMKYGSQIALNFFGIEYKISFAS